MITKQKDMVVTAKEHMRGGEGTVHLTSLCAELPAHMRLFSRIVLEKGESIGYQVHENETELFYFVQGTAEVRDDDAVYTLTAGDSMATSSGHGHGVKNIGEDTLVLVAAIVLD